MHKVLTVIMYLSICALILLSLAVTHYRSSDITSNRLDLKKFISILQKVGGALLI